MALFRPTLILLVVLLTFRASAQMELLYHEPSGFYSSSTSVLLEDGSMTALIFSNGSPYHGYSFKRIDTSGLIISSYYFSEGVEYARLKHHPDGYMFLFPHATTGPDVLVLDQADQVILSKKTIRTFTTPSLLNDSASFNSAANAGGDIYLLVQHPWLGRKVIEVVRMNMNGELIWATNVGDPASSYEDVPASIETGGSWKMDLQVDDQDNAYVLLSYPGRAQILKLSPNGELQWARELAQSPHAHNHPGWSMALDDLGRLNIAVHRVNYEGAVVFFTFSPAGELLGSDGYASIHLTDMDHRYLTLHNGKRYFSGYYGVVETDTMGTPGMLHMPQISSNEIILSFHADASITYAVVHAIPGPGTATTQEVYVKMPDGTLNSCLFSPQEMVYFDAAEEYTLSSMDQFSSFDVTSAYQILEVPVMFEARPLSESQPLCPFIVGVEEHTAAPPADPVITTLVLAGTPIALRDGISGAIIIHSSDGQMIYNGRVSGNSGQIATSGWSPGLYFLRVFDVNNGTTGFTRIMIH